MTVGFAKPFKLALYEHLRSLNITKTYATVEFWNPAAIRVQLGLGSKVLGFEHLYRFGYWKKRYEGSPKENERIKEWCESYR